MFARYASVIDDTASASFLWSVARGFVHANPAARTRIEDPAQAGLLEGAAGTVVRSCRAIVTMALDTSFLLLPLLDINDRCEYVIAVEKCGLEDAPLLLHELSIARKREERVARILQTAMLPISLPHAHGLAFQYVYRPAESNGPAGGDWYDAYELPDGRVAFSVGDVAGHGLEAAVVMGHVRESIRTQSMNGASPARALAETNTALMLSHQSLVTAFVGYLDPLTLVLEYANAGHPPPYLADIDGSVRGLAIGDVILGAVLDAEYATHRRQLDERHALFLYTDGLIEQERDAVQGDRELRQSLATWGRNGFAASAADFSQAILGSAPVRDDVAVLVVRTLPVTNLDARLPNNLASAARARAAISRVLGSAPLGERRFDFLVAMGEAVNNALEHGSPFPRDTIHVRLDCDGYGARGSVESNGAWRWKTPTIERGRGLMLMRALTDRVNISVAQAATTVTLRLDAPPVNA